MSRSCILIIIALALTLSKCNKPIIAMFANCDPDSDYTSYTKSYVAGSYVRWVQESGADVMVIQPWYTIDQITTILPKINGVIFQGGSRTFKPTEQWEKAASYIIQYSIDSKENGEYFAIMGICQGFQVLHQLISNAETEADILENYDNNKVLAKVIFTEKTEKARLYSLFTKADFAYMSDIPSTAYFHTYGVSKTTFNKFETLGKTLDVTGLGVDKQNKEFINSIEGKDGLPIYGTQYHPEKIAYDRSESFEMEQNIEGRKISQLIGLFFISEARKSKNTMTEEEKKKYDFITSYSKGNYDTYDNNNYYWSKKD